MRWLLSMIGLSYHKAVGVLQSLQTGMHTYAALIVLFCDFPFYDNTPLYTLWDGFGPTWINFGICTTEEQNRTRIWGRRIRITFWVFKHAHDRQKWRWWNELGWRESYEGDFRLQPFSEWPRQDKEGRFCRFSERTTDVNMIFAYPILPHLMTWQRISGTYCLPLCWLQSTSDTSQENIESTKQRGG